MPKMHNLNLILRKNQTNPTEGLFKITGWGTSLAVQWLRLCTPNAGGTGSISGRGTKIPHATWRGQKYWLVIFKSVKVMEA